MGDPKEKHRRLGRVLETEMVFVVGATRWGTAWTQRCLDAHPDICCKGEGHFTDQLFPMLAKVFDGYNQSAARIGNRMQLGGLSGNAAGFTFEDVDYLMAASIGLMFDRWTSGGTFKCLAEKTPEHVLALDLLNRILPAMKVVHIVRDGRDEAVSAWDFNHSISRGEFARRYPTFADYAEAFARNWGQSVGAARRFGRANRPRFLQIKCEDLANQPAPVVRRLFRFCGVSDEERLVGAAVDEAFATAPLDLEPGVWLNQFDEDARQRFDRHCLELLKLLGYAEDTEVEP